MNYTKILMHNLKPRGEFPACYAFGMHKAGSSLMHLMILQVCAATNTPAMNIPTALFHEGLVEADWDTDPEIVECFAPGRVYFGFRKLPPILLNPRLALREKRSVLLVRDPRDALVSEFYSYGGHLSHALPAKNADKFISAAKSTQHLTIDDYVLRASPGYLAKLNGYLDALDFRHILLRRYEQVYFDKHKFLSDIFIHFGLEIPAEIIAAVAAQNDVRPVVEDPSKHIRKGEPGDHRLKLKPDTITKLNNIFRETCRLYGYELEA